MLKNRARLRSVRNAAFLRCRKQGLADSSRLLLLIVNQSADLLPVQHLFQIAVDIHVEDINR